MMVHESATTPHKEFLFDSRKQATLGLAMDILLLEENGWVVLQQEVGHLINAIVAVLGPELHPESIFFSSCKSVIAEISLQQETTTFLEDNIAYGRDATSLQIEDAAKSAHAHTFITSLEKGYDT